ncbi:Alcohol dehydrogenase [NADP(+)] A [Holothuria leucospilota]|uniref:Alcohol dehydrogenase [NADP(+)] A n=1 Tax=Holothuria leucospilota TaxID=206669 RepID=A0A9Q1BRZ2_HOLLE|nr:Alcohol dehydrogenase [NADP(+)] A [Holothuria leucospilota]
MEALVERGLTKSVGVSNFNVTQLSDVLKATTVPCVVIQIENHPFLDQKELIDLCKSKNVTVTSYSPLGSPDRPCVHILLFAQFRASDKDPSLLTHPVIKEMSETKGCTPGQLLIAYHLEQGLVCIPKSVTPSRIQENFGALDVKLTDEDIKKLDDTCCNFRACTWYMWKGHIHYPFEDS